MSTTGLAPSPGTEVEPTCSRRGDLVAECGSDPRRLFVVSGRPLGVVGADRVRAGPSLGRARLRARSAETSEQRESVEQRLLGGIVVRGLLRVPLHPEHPGRMLVLLVGNDPLDRLDQTVLAPARDRQVPHRAGRPPDGDGTRSRGGRTSSPPRGGSRVPGAPHGWSASPRPARRARSARGCPGGAGGACRRTRRSSAASLDRCRASAWRVDPRRGAGRSRTRRGPARCRRGVRSILRRTARGRCRHRRP